MSALADPSGALRAVELLTGLAVCLSALELLCLRSERGRGGFYYWQPAHAPDLQGLPVPLRPVLTWLYAEPGFSLLSALRLVLGAALAAGLLEGAIRAPGLFALLGLGLAAHHRLRFGTTGAELMMGIVLGGLAVGALRPGDPLVQRGVLWFVALQSVLTYAATGVTKLRVPEWRDGSYLRAVFRSRTMGHPLGAWLTREPSWSRLLSLAIIGFECAFPLALVTGPSGALLFCAAAAVFHLAIAWMMGLKMFVLIFAATYPAVLFCAAQASALLWG